MLPTGWKVTWLNQSFSCVCFGRMTREATCWNSIACENCKRLRMFDLTGTDVTAIYGVLLLALCEPGTGLVSTEAETHWQRSLFCLLLASRSPYPTGCYILLTEHFSTVDNFFSSLKWKRKKATWQGPCAECDTFDLCDKSNKQQFEAS